MNTSAQQWYPKGFFPLLLRVEDKEPSAGSSLTPQSILSRFTEMAKEKYGLRTRDESSKPAQDRAAQALGQQADTHRRTQKPSVATAAETRVAVPFSDRERIRIDYNIYASEIDGECGTPLRFHFHMESDF